MDIIEKLKQAAAEDEILLQEPMANHTTFRVGGPAEYFVSPTVAELPGLMKVITEENIPYTILGNGSNVLVSDQGLAGVVIVLGKNAQEIKRDGNVITAEAGALLSRVAAEALSASLTGMEPLGGIPGSIGGAVMMNAGAYGGEIRQVLTSAEVLCANGQVKTYTVEELDLSYRHSILMEEKGIVLSATFTLQEGNPEEIKAQMADYRERRTSKQPLNFPSAGSTFKRPEGYFAGKLIEDAGLKGYRVGGACVSEKHAGFVVNDQNGTAADVYQVICDVSAKVKETFGVTLEPEVRILGEFS